MCTQGDVTRSIIFVDMAQLTSKMDQQNQSAVVENAKFYCSNIQYELHEYTVDMSAVGIFSYCYHIKS